MLMDHTETNNACKNMTPKGYLDVCSAISALSRDRDPAYSKLETEPQPYHQLPVLQRVTNAGSQASQGFQ